MEALERGRGSVRDKCKETALEKTENKWRRRMPKKKTVKTEEKRENVLKRRQGSGKYNTVEDKHRLRGKS